MRLRSLLLIVAATLSSCTNAVSRPIDSAAPDRSSQTVQESMPLPIGPKAPAINNPVWLNVDRPLTQADLNGKVILIDFWTFG